MSKSFLNDNSLPRGLRNNNPGNLRRLPPINGKPQMWNGEVPYHLSKDSSFSQFYDLKHGIRAKFRDIITDYRKGLNTITLLINEFAPPNENDTVKYISVLVRETGLSALVKFELTQEILISIAKAILLMENGPEYQKYVTDQDYKEAMAILGIDLPKKKI